MQDNVIDWFVNNLASSIALMIMIFIILLSFYIKRYVKIFDPRIHITHYRRERILREYPHGGMVITMPFFDRIEARLNEQEEPRDEMDDF